MEVQCFCVIKLNCKQGAVAWHWCLRTMLMSPALGAPIAESGQVGFNHVDLGILSLQGLLLALNPHHFS